MDVSQSNSPQQFGPLSGSLVAMAAASQSLPGGPAPGAGLGENPAVLGSLERLTPSAVNRIMMEFLIYFGRAVVVFYPVYLTGYLGLSISWVLLCMVMITWWKKNRQWKDARIGSAIDFVDNETHVISTELKGSLQMASWVCKACQMWKNTVSLNSQDVNKLFWTNAVRSMGVEGASVTPDRHRWIHLSVSAAP